MTTRSDVAALRLFESPAAQSSLGFFRAGETPNNAIMLVLIDIFVP